jgi:hypothetical protein
VKRLALAFALLLAAPAQAQQLPLGSEIEALVADPDGSAWVLSSNDRRWSVGHAAGTFTLTRAHDELDGMTIGPDGALWVGGATRVLYRANAAGALTRIGALPENAPLFNGAFAAGPDSTLWAPLAAEEPTLARINVFGRATLSTIPALRCTGFGDLIAIERASDGAMWFAGRECGELLRLTPAGLWSTVALGSDQPERLAADAAGGVWYATPHTIGHVDASGTVSHTLVPERADNPADIAVGPDGAAYVVTGRCQLGRVVLGQELTLSTPPIPALRIEFAPDGTRWLASRTRLVRGESAAACDDEGPRAAVTPKRLRLATLRRRGVRFTVAEPALLSLFVVGLDEARRKAGRRLVYRPSARALRQLQRRLDARRRASFYYTLGATDRDGNTYYTEGTIRVTR